MKDGELGARRGPSFRSVAVDTTRTTTPPPAELPPGFEVLATSSSTSRERPAAMTGQVMGGIDVQLLHDLTLGARVSYEKAGGFDSVLFGRRNYGGVEAGLSVGWLFGRGARVPR